MSAGTAYGLYAFGFPRHTKNKILPGKSGQLSSLSIYDLERNGWFTSINWGGERDCKVWINYHVRLHLQSRLLALLDFQDESHATWQVQPWFFDGLCRGISSSDVDYSVLLRHLLSFFSYGYVCSGDYFQDQLIRSINMNGKVVPSTLDKYNQYYISALLQFKKLKV